MRISIVAPLFAAVVALGLGAWAKDGGIVLSLSKEGNTLHAFDAGSFEPLGTYPVGVGPHEVVTDASGRFAYVSNYGNQQPGNSISVIDLQEGKPVTTIDLGELRRPHGLWQHEGKIYFTSEVAQSVGRIDVASNKLDWTAKTNRQGTHMLVVSPKTGEIFTADIGGPSVTVIDPKAGEGAQPVHVEVPGQPEAIAISPDSTLIAVGDNAGGTITLIDAKSKQVVGTIEGGGMPIRVGFTPDGKKILSTDPRASVLQVFDVAKREKLGEVAIDRAPIGFVINPQAGQVYVSASATGRVAVVDLAKLEVVRQFDTGAVPDGIGLAFPKGEVAKAQASAPKAARSPEEGAPPPRLGVILEAGASGEGVRISEVLPSSLAEKAGLKAGDVILKVNGEVATDAETVVSTVRGLSSGQTVKLTIVRGGQQHEFEAKLP